VSLNWATIINCAQYAFGGEAFEIKMASRAILVPVLVQLLGAAAAVSSPAGRAGVLNPGPHGFSEVLYALSSTGNSNGSAFAGLNANGPVCNLLLGLVMLVARYWVIIPILALAGSLAAKCKVPEVQGPCPPTPRCSSPGWSWWW